MSVTKMDFDEMYRVNYLNYGKKRMVGNGFKSKISLIPVKIPISLKMANKTDVKERRINYRSEFNNLSQFSNE